MLIKTLLNKVKRFKSFVYDTVQIITIAGTEARVIDWLCKPKIDQ